ncbi:MAG: type VI secretion system baseplate subunit TssE [bacterium]
MAELRLLERLRVLEDGSAQYQAIDEVHSVIEHVKRLLNTRVGSAQIADDYGIPDFTDVVGVERSQMVYELCLSIKEVITRYEPRLTNVKITVDPERSDEFSLKFRAEGVIIGGRNLPVVFETVISTDGKIEVSDRY